MSPNALLRRLAWPTDPGAFRLWLALLIVVHHLTGLEIGKAPVLVFFVLSGFWVQRVWHDRYRHTRHPWLTFIISRWWRLAPLLVLATPLAIAMQALTRTIATGSMALALGLFTAVLATPGLRETYLAPDAPEYVTLNLLLGALLIPFALATAQPARRPDRTDALLADQSYLIYMLHWPAITLFRHIDWASPFIALFGAFALMALVASLSLLVWHYFDRPLNRARKRWVDSRLIEEIKKEEAGDLPSPGPGDLAVALNPHAP